MKLAQIRILVAVAERGNLRSSAEELGVSQLVIMRSINDLERELGTVLLRRSKDSVSLTPVGEAFVRRVSAAQIELDRARYEVSRVSVTSIGVVSVGVSASPHVSILPQVLMPFQSRFSNIRVRIVEGAFPKLERDVRDGTLDFYVGPIWPYHRTSDLTIERLYNVARIVVGRKGHPLAGAKSLADIADARWIATSRLELDPLFERHRLPKPTIIVEVETGLSMLSAAAASDNLVILPESWLALVERTELLTPFRLDVALTSPSIYIVTRTQMQLTNAASYMRDLIFEAARNVQLPPDPTARD